MAKKLQFRRLWCMALVLCAAFAGLGYRLVDLQVLQHEQLRTLAEERRQLNLVREPRRGQIYDVRSNLLAASVFVKTVCADPVLIGNQQALVARTLAPLLQLDQDELFRRLFPRLRRTETGKIVTNRYVVLKRKVPAETWQKISETMSSLSPGRDEKTLSRDERAFWRNLRQRAVFADPVDDQLRTYPHKALLAHVLGYVGTQEREFGTHRLIETYGLDGIELTLNNELAGVPGWRVTGKDPRRREIVGLRQQDVEPHDGLDVVLTVDIVIQHIVRSALLDAFDKYQPISAGCVVVRPKTGEILAMCVLPDFDPNEPGNAPAEVRRNRLITDMFEPGSTFKIVVVSAALNEGIVTLADTFHCEHGKFAYAGKILRDHHPYGVLTVEEIITKSSNIGAAKIGLKLGAATLHKYITDFGFGTRTGIPLPGEASGIVHPLKDWTKLSITRIPMGHEVAATPLQMVMAMCAIANGGWLMRPMIIDRLQDPSGRVLVKYQPQPVRQVITEQTAKQMIQALKTVTTPEGTGAKAALEHYTVAGKTGTAQKTAPGVRGYVPGKYFSSFIGFFPADTPEVCIGVFLDEPRNGYYGGQVAAPVFRQIAARVAQYLNIPPDAAPQSAGAATDSDRSRGGTVGTNRMILHEPTD
ncbi:MAG: penicillin-binding protein 2 [Verrucomicrobiae bacterium]|nr:penicillin-binding protein 2 [Verrucomicrobiae bacterium]MDW7981136.1 penicillin-binding protein 2 [Verrucomicrobiales bacterium]